MLQWRLAVMLLSTRMVMNVYDPHEKGVRRRTFFLPLHAPARSSYFSVIIFFFTGSTATRARAKA
eukprot:4551017-Prymnesium_polylepis.1